MNIIPTCEYCDFTNNIPIQEYFQSIHEYLILIRDIYREWTYISLWFSLPGRRKRNIKMIYKKEKKSDICE